MASVLRAGTVVQTVPAARAYATVATLEGLLALAVMMIDQGDWLSVLIGCLFGAVIWGGLLIWMRSRSGNEPLRLIAPDELPPKSRLWQVTVTGAAFLAVFYAGAVAAALSFRTDFLVGLALGVPIVLWDSFRKAKRAERELRGTLWGTATIGWAPNDRLRYLVADG